MNYAEIKYNCASNGPGVRTAFYVSGCNIKCKGCFNQELWDFKYGKEFTDEVLRKVLDSMDHDWIAGLSVLGGEPLDPDNQESVLELVLATRRRFGENKTIWLWTGYFLGNIPKTKYLNDILSNLDVLVGGPFMNGNTSPKVPFRGSNNQVILELKKHHDL